MRWLALPLLVAATCAASAEATTPRSGLPNGQRLTALYVIDHHGRSPRGDIDLIAYSNPFEKVLGGCTTRPDALTMTAINLSDKASRVGARNVTALTLLKMIARRVTWSAPRNCQSIYTLVEGRAENGDA